MEYTQREYPQFSACGLNCGLCPRYHTAGTSKCPCCSGNGFLLKHPKCGVLSCCQRKNFEYCYQCGEFPCEKYDGVYQSDSFISHLNQLSDLEKAKTIGMDAYARELNEKTAILETLLDNYDDGRRKNFFCIADSRDKLEFALKMLNRYYYTYAHRHPTPLPSQTPKPRRFQVRATGRISRSPAPCRASTDRDSS